MTTPAPSPVTPAAPAAPAPAGRGLAIAGLILAFVAPLIGLILSIVAVVKLRKSGGGKGLAIAGIIIGALFTLGWIIAIVAMATAFGSLAATCAELGPGVWEVGGVTYTCG